MRGAPANGRQRRIGICVAAFLVSALAGVPAAFAATRPVNIASVSVSSLARLAHEAADLGIDLPPALTVAGIEQQFPFIGPGGLDPDRPAGVFLFTDPDAGLTSRGDGVVIVLPVKRDVATLKSFLDAGGRALGGGSGAVQLNGTCFRRTPTCLIFGRMPAAVIDVRDADLLDGYRPPSSPRAGPNEPLARASIDVAAIRRIDPWRFTGLVDGIARSATAKAPNGGIVTADTLVALANRLSRIDLALLRNGDEMSVKFGFAPIRIPAGGTFARPGMPQEVIARLDLGAPPLQVMPWLATVFGRTGPATSLVDAARGGNDFVRDFAGVLLAGDAVSIGLEPREKNAIFYVVQQHVPSDPVARLRQLVEQSGLAASRSADASHATFLDFTGYETAAGLRVARVKVMEGKACTFCIDLVRRADTVYLTGSADQGQYLESLIDAKQAGQFSGMASGSVSLGAALAFIEDAAGPAGLPPDQRDRLHRLLKGRSLTVSATGEMDEAIFGLSLPRDLLKDLVAAYYASASK